MTHINVTQTREILSTASVDKFADNFPFLGFFRLFLHISTHCLFFRQHFKLLIKKEIFKFIWQTPDFIGKIFTNVNVL